MYCLLFQESENVQCPAMWSYVMAAARGDPRRRPGSVFTVQSANCGPGPCRDGLNCSRYPLNSGYKSATFQKDGISRGFSRDELDTTISRDGSRDVLAEVRVQTPYSERCQSPTESPYTQPLQVYIFVMFPTRIISLLLRDFRPNLNVLQAFVPYTYTTNLIPTELKNMALVQTG